jgi:hypothetical protein
MTLADGKWPRCGFAVGRRFARQNFFGRWGVESVYRRLRTGVLNFVSAGKGVFGCPRVQSSCDCTPDDMHKEHRDASYPAELEMSQGM